jgi:hypothetical protein
VSPSNPRIILTAALTVTFQFQLLCGLATTVMISSHLLQSADCNFIYRSQKFSAKYRIKQRYFCNGLCSPGMSREVSATAYEVPVKTPFPGLECFNVKKRPFLKYTSLLANEFICWSRMAWLSVIICETFSQTASCAAVDLDTCL